MINSTTFDSTYVYRSSLEPERPKAYFRHRHTLFSLQVYTDTEADVYRASRQWQEISAGEYDRLPPMVEVE